MGNAASWHPPGMNDVSLMKAGPIDNRARIDHRPEAGEL